MTTRRSCDPLALLGDDSASTSAEFALIVPLFLILVFGTINGTAMLSAATQMHYAAERAARCLSVDVAGNCSAGAVDACCSGCGFRYGEPYSESDDRS